MAPSWYIVYTKPFRGKKVADFFSKKNKEHYYPLKRLAPKNSNPLKETFQPLFDSYVFVQAHDAPHDYIKMIPEAISIVYWLEKPAVIPNEEITAIKRFLSLYFDVGLEKIPVCFNVTKSVMHDSLIQENEMEPELIKGFVKVRLPSLGYMLKASIPSGFTNTSGSLILDNDQPLLSENLTGNYRREI